MAAQPPCVAYLDPIMQYVKLYSGGGGAPIVRFLEGFAKEYGGSKKLGETFLSAVASAKFPTESSKFPFLRGAMLATNLISPKAKVVDGVAKLLSKSDVTTIASKPMLVKATAAEQILSEAWSELQELSKARKLSIGQCNALFGRLASRLVLHILKKEKGGPEVNKYDNLTAVKTTFRVEKSKDLGDDVATGTAAAPATAAAASSSGRLSSIDDVSNPQWIADGKGFAVGKYYTETGDGSKVFKLLEFTCAGANFELFSLAPIVPERKSVDFEGLKKWKLHSRPLPQKLTADISGFMADNHRLVKQELAKASLFTELMQLSVEWAEYERSKVDFFFGPAEVRAKANIPKGEMRLIPTTDIGRLSMKSGTSSTTATSDSFKFFLDSPQRPTKAPTESDPWPKHIVMSAYWWIKTTDTQAEANLKRTSTTVTGWTIDVLENTKAIKPFEKFVIYVPAGPAAKKSRT